MNNAPPNCVNGGFESGTGFVDGVVRRDHLRCRRGGPRRHLEGLDERLRRRAHRHCTSARHPVDGHQLRSSFWLRVDSGETTTTNAYDTFKVQVRSSSGAVLATLATYSNLNKGTSFVQKTFDLAAYKGQTVRDLFRRRRGSTVATSFIVDDVSLTVQ